MIFRVDGSTVIGTGHLMRCLTLADALSMRGIASTFVSRALPEGLMRLLDRGDHTLVRLPEVGPQPPASAGIYGRWLGTTEAHDAETFAEVVAEVAERPFAVVVDHYALSRDWESTVRRRTGLPIMAIDDLGRSHDADVVLDCTYGKTRADYAGRVSDGCRLLVGSHFALLRPDFARERPGALRRRAARLAGDGKAAELLVSMGGGDPDDVLGFLLEGLLPLARRRGLRLNALVGAAYPRVERLERLAEAERDHLRLHRQVTDMASLLAEMDVCIGAAGSSAWERCCLGLPTINLTIAENQRSIARNLAAGGLAEDGGEISRGQGGALLIDGRDAATWVRDRGGPFLDDREGLRRMSERAAAAVDGFGALRAVEAILQFLPAELPVTLVPATAHHAGLLFEWQAYPGMRRHFRNPEPPEWGEHVTWLERRLANAGDRIRLVEYGGIPAGLVRLERTELSRRLFSEELGWEVSVLIAPELQGRGLASRAIALALEEAGDEPVAALVAVENTRSLKAFRKCGFVAGPCGALVNGASGAGLRTGTAT